MRIERNDIMAKKKQEAEEKINAKEPENQEVKQEKKEPEKSKEKPKASKEDELKKQLDEKNDQLLRIAAEYDNFRKRSQREKDALYVDCKSSVIKDLLPVVDNVDRIFENQDAKFEDYKKGVEMTFGQLNDAFKKLGVESFGEAGEQFDPNLHNAVMHTEDDTLGENTITQVLAKGYKLGEKIIRPAMVAVAN